MAAAQGALALKAITENTYFHYVIRAGWQLRRVPSRSRQSRKTLTFTTSFALDGSCAGCPRAQGNHGKHLLSLRHSRWMAAAQGALALKAITENTYFHYVIRGGWQLR